VIEALAAMLMGVITPLAAMGIMPATHFLRPKLSLGGVKMLGGFFSSAFEKQEVNYAGLTGLPASFGKEAGENALAGMVPLKSKDGWEIASFAGGCFWGTEIHFQRVPGVIATCVGYTQGKNRKPTYNEVCSGSTGHTEGIQVIFDPKACNYATLCETLFKTIDASLLNQVGNDRGTQYRHGIYPHSDEQMKIATACVAAEQKKYRKPIVTEVKKTQIFWPAEQYHQQYLEKGGRFGEGQSTEKGCSDRVRCYG